MNAVDPAWYAPESAWWAKMRRAARHIREVREQATEFEDSNPWSVESSVGPAPNESTYLLRVSRPVPSDLITAIGDAIHNMRSALDAVAYEFAHMNLGTLNPTQEKIVQFPIVPDGGRFDKFLRYSEKDASGVKVARRDLYSDDQVLAFRCVQSFAFAEEAAALGIEFDRHPDIDYRHHMLNRLHSLSVIDKHRRLPILAWFPDIVYWQGEPQEVQEAYEWRPAHHTPTSFLDGVVLGRFVNPEGEAPPSSKLTHAMKLTFGDDPSGPNDGFAESLGSWYDSLVNWILPRMFVTAAGNTPPVGFFNG